MCMVGSSYVVRAASIDRVKKVSARDLPSLTSCRTSLCPIWSFLEPSGPSGAIWNHLAFWSHLKQFGLIWGLSGGCRHMLLFSLIWFDPMRLNCMWCFRLDVIYCVLILCVSIQCYVMPFHSMLFGLMLFYVIQCGPVVFDSIWGGLSSFVLVLVDPIWFALVWFHLSWFDLGWFDPMHVELLWFDLACCYLVWFGFIRCCSVGCNSICFDVVGFTSAFRRLAWPCAIMSNWCWVVLPQPF